jgi:hypothetical protein
LTPTGLTALAGAEDAFSDMVDLRYAAPGVVLRPLRSRNGAGINGILVAERRGLTQRFLFGRPLWPGSLIRASCQKTRYRNVFVQFVPMETTGTKFIFLVLFLGCARQPGKPGQWNAEHLSVRQFNRHHSVIKADADRLNQRMRSGRL